MSSAAATTPKEAEASQRLKPFPDPAKLDSNSPSVESLVSSRKDDTPSASDLDPLSISLPFSSFGIGWKCSKGQQEEQNHSKAHSVGCEERRRTEQAVGGVTIANGGVLPNIHQNLLPKKASKGRARLVLFLKNF
ncbi:hypothetical protein CXB51_018916 [Gossypium anomalum]|uniref:Histone H2A C-terminal domain-containing protein n=1 Tax=Gossypium anomalum TaxID=47600 RepID=A0A8J6CSA3_9ROSI|nr:hypothetical protein CXB51_018916 [Gossypium anomalum]